jgi:uncharacterized protein YlzI (FlbEa/FlbD family)
VEKKYLVILIDALIKEAINKAEFTDTLRGPRGFKGKDGEGFDLEVHGEALKQYILQNIPKFELSEEQRKELTGPKGETGEPGLPGKSGKDGKDFSFDESQKEIESILVTHITNIQDTLKLRFSDLTDEEKESLRGLRGADGKAFILSENIEEISSLILSHIKEIKEDLKLKFTDLSEDEIATLRGPRGQRGKQGKDFVFDEHKDRVIDIIADYIGSIQSELKLKFADLTPEDKDSLKLKFDDLTDDDKRSLKGARGQRGKQGIQGEKGDKGNDGQRGSVWSESKKSPEVYEWNSHGDIHLNTDSQDLFMFSSTDGWKKIANIRGARGVPGVPGVQGERGFSGLSGRNGKDAPVIVDVETIQRDSTVRLKFIFSDGSEVISDSFEIPDAKVIKNIFMSGFGGGDGGGGDGKSAYEIAVDNGFVGTEQDWLDSLVGDSAYDVAVNNGFVGTEQDWLDSLVGPQGPPGSGGSGGCLEIYDEGILVNNCAPSLDFVGPNVEVTYSDTFMSDWTSLDILDTLDEPLIRTTVTISADSQNLQEVKEYSENISALKLLSPTSSNEVKVASTDTFENATVMAVAIFAGSTSNNLKVHLFGKLSDPSFNFPVNDVLFLSDLGNITNIVPSGAYLTRVGYSLGIGAIFFNPTTPIEA